MLAPTAGGDLTGQRVQPSPRPTTTDAASSEAEQGGAAKIPRWWSATSQSVANCSSHLPVTFPNAPTSRVLCIQGADQWS